MRVSWTYVRGGTYSNTRVAIPHLKAGSSIGGSAVAHTVPQQAVALMMPPADRLTAAGEEEGKGVPAAYTEADEGSLGSPKFGVTKTDGGEVVGVVERCRPQVRLTRAAKHQLVRSRPRPDITRGPRTSRILVTAESHTNRYRDELEIGAVHKDAGEAALDEEGGVPGLEVEPLQGR